MRFLSLLAAATLLLATGARATQAASGRLEKEVAETVDRLKSEDRVERAYGAISVRHLAARESGGFRLLSRTQLAPWQQTIAPVIPLLIELLRDDMPLQWVDDKDQPTVETVTTARREAGFSLVALERAAVEPLIAVADDKVLGPRADQVLRQLFKGGPAGRDRAAWTTFWTSRREQPFTNERGQWPFALGVLLLIAAMVGFLLWRQRVRAKAEETRGSIFPRAAAPSAPPPTDPPAT